MANDQNSTKESGNILSQGLSRVRSLFQTNDDNSKVSKTATTIQSSPSTAKDSQETYRAWGVRLSGNAGANHTALAPALQACYTQNVNEQNSNQAIQAKNQQSINSQIETQKGKRDGEKIKLESKQRDRQRLSDEIKEYSNKIDEIKSSDGKNIMAKVNFVIGAVITFLLAIYLFLFYSSASFSALLGNNNDITGVGDAIFDPHCYEKALNYGLGQLMLILLMPVIFLGLGFLIHQFGEAQKGWTKYVKIGSLYIVTFIFDALLAFGISRKIFDQIVYDEINLEYTVSMAFNSPDFWIVIFSGFVAYVIWGLVFDFTLQHFDNMNAHTKEIKVLEDKIKNTKLKLDNMDTSISQIELTINALDTEIARLNTQLQNHTLIDKNVLKEALSNFFTGWIAYMHLAAKPQEEQDLASQTYEQFISQI